MFKKFFSLSWRIINVTRSVILNIIFFILLLLFILAISADDNSIVIPKNAALVLNLQGKIVEQKQQVNPVDAFMAEATSKQKTDPEVLLSDILYVIEHAKNNANISLLVLQLNKMQNSGLSKLQDIALALEDFKLSGKEVIAIGEQYSQAQYYLASYADHVWLNPKGWLLFEGFSRYQTYFKKGLEKLSIQPHIFRVGTYKSAVEPFIRNDMSPEAKEANLLWLSDLWQQYKTDVAQQRGMPINNFDDNVNVLLEKITQANGSVAEYALNNQWVDALKTREEMRKALTDRVGSDNNNSYKHVSFQDYLALTKQDISFENPNTDKVAIIVAKGNILNGVQKPGNIGGTSTAALLRKARFNDSVKAVVLRVDSPGGSAYASEIIRQEVELLKASGKPVVASMGSYAASGGYWISAPADKIIASPSTITGSIGIFGLMVTFEETLEKVGVYTDGVGTTDLGGFNLTRPLDENIGQLIQLTINRGYQDFIELVAQNRNMTTEQVDKVAQGRVWSGNKAKELGLVDELGNLQTAIQVAAQLSGLERYETKLIEKEKSAFDKFVSEALGQTSQAIFNTNTTFESTSNNNLATNIINNLQKQVAQLSSFNDPQGAYVLCVDCEINM